MKICSVIYARILIIEESTSRIFTLKHRRSYETKHSEEEIQTWRCPDLPADYGGNRRGHLLFHAAGAALNANAFSVRGDLADDL